MTFKKKRAFHFGGASWLLLCAMADGALAQDAAAPAASTQLPEITVTAPSPIVRRKPVVPSRTPARVARAAPGQNRERAAEPQAAPGRRRAPAGRAARRDRSVRDRHRRAQRGNPPLRQRDARRSPVFKARHHRLQLRAGRLQPADHPGPRRQPRRHRRERHRRRRRLRSRRGSFRADRSARHQPGRSRARPGGVALRLDLDRRRRQRDQQPHSGRPAHLPGGAVPELRAAGQGAAGGCAITHPASPSRPERPSARSIAASKAASCSMPAAAISRSMPTPMAARPAITAFPSYPYLFDQTRPVNGRQPNSAAQADGASVGGSYIFQGGFIGAAITQNDALYRIPGIDGADHQTRIDAHQTKFTAKGEYRPDAAAIDAVRFWAGATDYKHNEIGLADPADLSSLRRAADLYQQGAGRPRRGADDAVQRALCRRHDGVRPAGRPSGTDGAEPGRSRQPAQRFVGSRTRTPGSPATSSTSSSSPTPPRRRSPAASSMSVSAERRRRSFRSCSTSTPIPAISGRRSRAT